MIKPKPLIGIALAVCVLVMAVSCNKSLLSNPSTTPIGPSSTIETPSLPTTPPKTEPNPASDFAYTVNNDKVSITEYRGSGGDVVIPAEIEGRKVTSIGQNAFRWCTHLTSINMPNSITNIGNGAFYRCVNLTSVFMTGGVTVIGVEAFAYCSNLTYVAMPDSMTTIDYAAFSHCASLVDITIPDSVINISSNIFFCMIWAMWTPPPGVTAPVYYVNTCGERPTVITCSRNSYAHEYCVENQVPFQLLGE